MSGAKRRKFFCRAPSLFGFTSTISFFGFTSTISRFGERFRDGQCSLDTFFFCFSILGAPRAQSSVKVRAREHVPYGVGATFVGQFHTKNIIKQPFNLNA